MCKYGVSVWERVHRHNLCGSGLQVALLEGLVDSHLIPILLFPPAVVDRLSGRGHSRGIRDGYIWGGNRLYR